MTWAAPLAGLLALGLVIPLIAHLWSRRRPRPVPFPTLRFLRGLSQMSRRLRRVQDWPLLLLRLAIVALLAVAAAGPTIVTTARQRHRQQQLHRVIVVDERVAGRTDATIARLSAEAAAVRVLGPDDVLRLLPQATSIARRAARTQRSDIVVLWDGSRASLARRDLDGVPIGVGLRLHVAGTPPSGPGNRAYVDSDRLPIEIRADPSDAVVQGDLIERLRSTTVASPARAIRVVWPGAAVDDAIGAAAHGGRFDGVLDALQDDLRLREAAERSLRDRRGVRGRPAGARVLARSRDGEPLLSAWWFEEELRLALEATPSSPLALWSAVAAIEALSEPARWAAAQPGQSWTPDDVAAMEREATPPTMASLPGGLDTRAAWALVLVLLLAEQWWRRARPTDVVDPMAASDDARPQTIEEAGDAA